ncbi:MAG: nucleoside-diphosphate kinase [Candidatus Dojkabacteria bacterium]|nr:nucleoside-diphosphate kinase [Candidatus Dojkabacteria bacterium]MDQ7021755.1 nucleoside-diphosphate kinase [Candidatus Dojkabacteria bacterium]
MKLKTQKTLVVLKHDCVMRGLMGEVITRFERVGLKLVAFEFLAATEDMGDKHYASSDENLQRFGNNTLTECKEKGIDPVEKYGTDDALEIGKMIKNWNVELITRGPVLAMVWEGPDTIALIRKLAGKTSPKDAAPGTIRGDFSWDNYEAANQEMRSVYNILHASGNEEEAEFEIKLWFGDEEVIDYTLYTHRAMSNSWDK